VSYRTHPDLSWRVEEIGAERQRVVVVDNFLAAPEVLVEAAAQATFQPVDRVIYPGVRARLPRDYPFAMRDGLREAFRAAFDLDIAHIVGGQTDFSIVTTRPEQAHLRQLYPHFDGPDPNVIAAVHYLCAPELGGTSFYRHRATGYEAVTADRLQPYVRQMEAEIAQRPRAQFTCGDTDAFERIASFAAAFNRLIFYRGVSLHGGDIGPDFAFDPDPRTGRLTANTFLMFRAPR
jgi:hypothetical protein